MNKFLFAYFLTALFATGSLFAGTLRGVVADKETGEPLAGAIIIVDSGRLNAASGLDGSFIIEGINAGDHSVKISYTAYKTDVRSLKFVDDNTEITLIAELQATENLLGNVEIKAKMKNGSYEQARCL